MKNYTDDAIAWAKSSSGIVYALLTVAWALYEVAKAIRDLKETQ